MRASYNSIRGRVKMVNDGEMAGKYGEMCQEIIDKGMVRRDLTVFKLTVGETVK